MLNKQCKPQKHICLQSITAMLCMLIAPMPIQALSMHPPFETQGELGHSMVFLIVVMILVAINRFTRKKTA